MKFFICFNVKTYIWVVVKNLSKTFHLIPISPGNFYNFKNLGVGWGEGGGNVGIGDETFFISNTFSQ